jgi:hypothetical protein
MRAKSTARNAENNKEPPMNVLRSIAAIGKSRFAAVLTVLVCSPVLAAPSTPLSDPVIHKAPTWHLPVVADVKAQAADWVHKNCKDTAAQAKSLAIVAGIADKADGTELLDRLGEAFAAADSGAAQLVDLCSRPRARAVLPSFAWMTDAKTAPVLAANMRLYFGRWLAQGDWFEEALEQIGSLKPAEVAAPAELLFYQGVAYHRMLNKEQGLKTLNQLLDGAEFAPRRYVAVAMLMQADLDTLEEGSLDHVARQMDGNGRWLDKGRAGPKVRKAEDRIVQSLDKIIQKMEDDQNKNNNPGNSTRSTKPAQNSTPMGGKAPGDVDKRDIGHKSGWGNLPPKEREEALQQMGKDFPPHYREAIEQYFRKLAAEEGNDEDK